MHSNVYSKLHIHTIGKQLKNIYKYIIQQLQTYIYDVYLKTIRNISFIIKYLNLIRKC